jgi:putative transposase
LGVDHGARPYSIVRALIRQLKEYLFDVTRTVYQILVYILSVQVLEFKLDGKESQYKGIDEAIRTTQFIRNKCLRAWEDENKKPKSERKPFGRLSFNYLCSPLAKEFPFADKLNAHARQAAAERAWSAVSRFYENCKKSGVRKKGYPKYQKDCRSVEYKTSGWKLSYNRKYLRLKDGFKIGWMKLRGGKQIEIGHLIHIKRVKIVKKAKGYYAQFSIDVPNVEYVAPTGKSIGLDVGLESFYTDSNGVSVGNPKFLRKSEKKLKRYQRRLSKSVKGSTNRKKQIVKVGRAHQEVSQQRKDFVVKTARCVVKSNDFVAVEDLKVRNMVHNHKLAKSISDASWRMFRSWLEHYGKKFGKVVQATNPAYTSQVCSECGCLPSVRKELKDRWHKCEHCGYESHRDHNAARNILTSALHDFSNTAGHAEIHACEDETSVLGGSDTAGMQVLSLSQESTTLG